MVINLGWKIEGFGILVEGYNGFKFLRKVFEDNCDNWLSWNILL